MVVVACDKMQRRVSSCHDMVTPRLRCRELSGGRDQVLGKPRHRFGVTGGSGRFRREGVLLAALLRNVSAASLSRMLQVSGG